MREDTNFKGSNLSWPSIYFLFYGTRIRTIRVSYAYRMLRYARAVLYIENITWLRGNMNSITFLREADEWDILLSTRNNFHISKHACNILFISETFTKKSKFLLQTK